MLHWRIFMRRQFQITSAIAAVDGCHTMPDYSWRYLWALVLYCSVQVSNVTLAMPTMAQTNVFGAFPAPKSRPDQRNKKPTQFTGYWRCLRCIHARYIHDCTQLQRYNKNMGIWESSSLAHFFSLSPFLLRVSQPAMSSIPYQSINWDGIEKVEHKGTTGTSFWQTLQFDQLRVRIVQYSAGYLADHWCQKGHIVHCLEGCFVNELETGKTTTLTAGMSYVVSDNLSSHRSQSVNGAKLLIIDGGFLKA